MSDYTHPWLPNDNHETIEKLNRTLGIKDWTQLFSSIPPNLMLKKKLNIGKQRPLTPFEIEKEFNKLIEKNPHIPLNHIFSGGPICPHYVHPLTEYVISRGEFLTTYTPYQAEINQGILQALYEYQSLIAILYGVDVVNSGMYDGATALAEAVLLSVRVKKTRKIMIPETLYPRYKSVLKTYLQGPEIDIIEYTFDEKNGEITPETIEKIRTEKPASVIIDYPSCTGLIRITTKELIEETHKTGALAIAYTEPTSLGLIKPPGELGADIITGEGQSLGLPLNNGGSLLGILGIQWDRNLLRNLPGRLIGKTVDKDGRTSYMMILQTREQHIRREKATSNITTNTALNAIATAINLSLLGEKGFKSLSRKIFENTIYLKEKLQEHNIRPKHEKGIYYKNIQYQLEKDEKTVFKEIVNHHTIIPFSFYDDQTVLSCATEIHTKKDIEALTKALGEINNV